MEVVVQFDIGQLLSFRNVSLENGAKPLLIETQFESVLVRELRDFLFSIYVVYRPEALQVRLVDCAVPDFGSLIFQLTANFFRKRFHSRKSPTVGRYCIESGKDVKPTLIR